MHEALSISVTTCAEHDYSLLQYSALRPCLQSGTARMLSSTWRTPLSPSAPPSPPATGLPRMLPANPWTRSRTWRTVIWYVPCCHHSTYLQELKQDVQCMGWWCKKLDSGQYAQTNKGLILLKYWSTMRTRTVFKNVQHMFIIFVSSYVSLQTAKAQLFIFSVLTTALIFKSAFKILSTV